MNRKTLALLFLIVVSALPAAAYTRQTECHGHWTRWQSPNIQFYLPRVDFDVAWENSIARAMHGWNHRAPGNNFRFSYVMVNDVTGQLGNNYNEIFVGNPQTNWFVSWDLPAVIRHKTSSCNPLNPLDVAHYEEVDIILNPLSKTTWDTNQYPTPANALKSSTLAVQHELGHALGINHEDAVLTAMNSSWPGPQGGPVSSMNDVMPLPDDLRGARAAYGTGTPAKDVTGSAVQLVSPGVSQVIPAPGPAFRNSQVSFAFTVHNLSTTDETIPVYFYMSPNRNINPNTSFYLGQTTIALGAGRTITGTAYLTVPANAPTGNQHFGWYVDPTNVIAEWNDVNNGTGLVLPTAISTNRVPSACFSATPLTGNAPLNVSFNASCTTDADADTLTYSWDLADDGMTASGKTLSYTYFMGGTYNVWLTVTDPSGATSKAMKTITVACTSRWCQEPE